MSLFALFQRLIYGHINTVTHGVKDHIVAAKVDPYVCDNNIEQTGYCKTAPRPPYSQTDGTVSFLFGVQFLIYALTAAIHHNRSRAWTYCGYVPT